MRILTIEDDELLAQTVANVLTQQHYAVDIALDGETGRQYAITTPYDLILLDIMLPELDGISLCQRLRQEGYQTPIVLLTAKDSCTDKVMGLDAGADDYVIKPVDFDELTARIRAVLRRSSADSSPLITWGALSLDPAALEVTYNNQLLHLTATEYRLLELFLRNPQRVFSRSNIIEHLWTFDNHPEAETVKTYIKNLRQKLKALGASTALITTVYGLGYRLKPEPDSSETAAESAEQCSKEQQALLAVAKAKHNFETQIRDRLNCLKQAVEALEVGIPRVEVHQQAIHEAHRFAGALGTFGFTAAAQLAEAIEDLLQIQPLTTFQLQQIRRWVADLSKELKQFLTQTAATATNEPAHLRLSVISKDTPWAKSLVQAASPQSFTVNSISVATESTWVEQILHLIQVESPDGILLDLEAAPMPQVMALLTELAKRLAIPVVVAAKHDDFDSRLEVARRGAHKFLLKTTSADRILEQAIQTLQVIQVRESRILVVANDRPTLDKIREIFNPWGLQLELLAEPQQFWQALITFSPDLLILDVELSGFSGIDLCRVVRTDPVWGRLPILFLTSRNDPETIHELFSKGADDYVSKPIAGAKLLTRVLNRLAREQFH